MTKLVNLLKKTERNHKHNFNNKKKALRFYNKDQLLVLIADFRIAMVRTDAEKYYLDCLEDYILHSTDGRVEDDYV